jgi:hypothetical protein
MPDFLERAQWIRRPRIVSNAIATPKLRLHSSLATMVRNEQPMLSGYFPPRRWEAGMRHLAYVAEHRSVDQKARQLVAILEAAI